MFKEHSSEGFIQLVKLNYCCWLAYFLLYNCYAVFWRQYAPDNGYSYISSIIYFSQEWGIWLVISPIVLWGLDRLHEKLSAFFTVLTIGLICLTAVFAARIQLNFGEYPSSWVETVIIMLPKYLPAYLIVSSVWFIKKKQQVSKANVETLLKEKGNGEEVGISIEHQGLNLVIKSEQIYSLKASGNYVEIGCKTTNYIKRITLKEQLTELPDGSFVQVHRSHAINLSKLVKLSNLDNGNGIATLSNQQKIAVSKKYKASLKSIPTVLMP